MSTYNQTNFPTVDQKVERVTDGTVEALQCTIETYISSFLGAANLITVNAKRQTLMVRDMETFKVVKVMEQFVGTPHGSFTGGLGYKEDFRSVKGHKRD